MFCLFKSFAAGGDEADSKHANSIDLDEFLLACDTLCIVPGPLVKKDAIKIFKDVNNASRLREIGSERARG
jgi:hypothetical protein